MLRAPRASLGGTNVPFRLRALSTAPVQSCAALPIAASRPHLVTSILSRTSDEYGQWLRFEATLVPQGFEEVRYLFTTVPRGQRVPSTSTAHRPREPSGRMEKATGINAVYLKVRQRYTGNDVQPPSHWSYVPYQPIIRIGPKERHSCGERPSALPTRVTSYFRRCHLP